MKYKKNKMMLAFIIVIIIIIIFVFQKQSKNTEILETTTTESTTESTESTQKPEDKPIQPNISIFTKDDYITALVQEVTQNTLSAVYDSFNNDLNNKILKTMPQNETIRIDINNAKIDNIVVTKTNITNSEPITQDVPITQSDDGIIDFVHTYDDNLKGTLYNVICTVGSTDFVYSFAFDSNVEPTLDNTPDIIPPDFFDENEQLFYDEYAKERDENVLLEVSPITVAKFYASAILNEDYNTAYSLFINYSETTNDRFTKEQFINMIQNDTYLFDVSNLFSLANNNGSFIDNGDTGYVEYTVGDNTEKFNMIKNPRGVWKIAYHK